MLDEFPFFDPDNLDKVSYKALEMLIDETTTNYIQMKFTDKEKTTLTSSKIGGIPYFPKDQDLPTNENGKNLYILLQINCADVPLGAMEDFPRTGIFQWYIDTGDDCYGIDWDDPTDQKSYRVVYHETIDDTVTEEDIKGKYNVDFNDDSPVPQKELAVSFILSRQAMTYNDYRFEEKLMGIYNSIVPEDHHITEPSESSVFDEIYEVMERNGYAHQLGGYPYFCQEDPRGNYSIYDNKDVILAQMDSESELDLMWGDCGVVQLFISPEDLKARNFSNVCFAFDCS